MASRKARGGGTRAGGMARRRAGAAGRTAALRRGGGAARAGGKTRRRGAAAGRTSRRGGVVERRDSAVADAINAALEEAFRIRREIEARIEERFHGGAPARAPRRRARGRR